MRILAATDGSRAGIAAVRFASRLATDKGCELIVLTVFDATASSPEGAGNPGSRLAAEKVLGDAARDMRHRRARARFELVRARNADDVPEAISRQANRLRVDLVVVGSEGRDSLEEWVVGGTALRLIYVARTPVTVVRAPRRAASR